MPQSMAPLWAKAGLDVELALNQTLTKSLLKIAQGRLDTAVIPPSAYAALKAGKGPYAKLGGKGGALAANVRALWAFGASDFHPVVWVDSGITDWSKVKGRRIFIGPPAGAANAQLRGLVKRASGYEDGKDYEGIKVPWGVAPQSFKDGQFDVLLLSAGVGAQVVTDIALSRKIRILPMPADAVPSPTSGLIQSKIPKGTYPAQVVNGDRDIPTWKTVMMFSAKKSLSNDNAYKLTKTYFESRKVLGAGNAMLKDLQSDNPFSGVIAPLHPGAARFYKEAGIAIPAKLMPR